MQEFLFSAFAFVLIPYQQTQKQRYFRPTKLVTFNELLCRKFPDYFNEKWVGECSNQ
jgi:hypothetical protein